MILNSLEWFWHEVKNNIVIKIKKKEKAALQIVLRTQLRRISRSRLACTIKSETLTHRINHSLCVSHRRQAMHGHVSRLGLCLNPHKQDPP